MSQCDLKFGVFMAPIAPLRENSSEVEQRDLELLSLLDQLGYDSAWLDVRHCANLDNIPRTEAFIAAATERTQRINFGMGVSRPPQRQPFFNELIKMAVTSEVSPAGAVLAGTHGLGLLSVAATTPGGLNALAVNWEIYERKANEFDQTVHRDNWSLAGPVHIAETREEAFNHVSYGLDDWLEHFTRIAVLPQATGVGRNAAEALVDSGLAVIGTPADAAAQVQRLYDETGGFGTFLQMTHNWVDWPQSQRSYELFIKEVAPEFNSSTRTPSNPQEKTNA